MIDWDKFEKSARAQVDKPYKFGAKWALGDPDPAGPVDCSGFTRWVYSRVGIYIPDGSQAQFLASHFSRFHALGDLGFFQKNDNIHHVGILLNETEVIEARGDPYNKIIIRPRKKWEAFDQFTGWQRPDAVYEKELD